jgi:NitT/TauT family transport system substrate-binding protein
MAMRTTLLAALAATLMATGAQAQDAVRFGTNWLAQGGHGGFYQAVADGTYAAHGLEVEIVMGGPQVNNRPLLAAGRLDFLMTGNLLLSFDNTRNQIPTTVIAAIYQRDPQVLIAHAGQYADWQALTTAPTVLISRDGQFSFWQWLTATQGFTDEQLRPYGFNLAQFLSDPTIVQQGYATSEPLRAAAQGVAVDTFVMADYGWSTYASTIEARIDMVENNPDLVQRFVDASIIGWYNFLYGDRTGAYALIMRDNPDATVESLDREVDQMMALNIIDSGRALEHGIGAMDMARVADFLRLSEEAGILEAGTVDVNLAATDRFVNRRVGIELRPN